MHVLKILNNEMKVKAKQNIKNSRLWKRKIRTSQEIDWKSNESKTKCKIHC